MTKGGTDAAEYLGIRQLWVPASDRGAAEFPGERAQGLRHAKFLLDAHGAERGRLCASGVSKHIGNWRL
jgi:hypothetical protein